MFVRRQQQRALYCLYPLPSSSIPPGSGEGSSRGLSSARGSVTLYNTSDVKPYFYPLPPSSIHPLQPQAREKAAAEGFEVRVAKTSFKANSKALAENEAEGMAKVVFQTLNLKPPDQRMHWGFLGLSHITRQKNEYRLMTGRNAQTSNHWLHGALHSWETRKQKGRQRCGVAV